jgi:hypothetical protein
LDAYERHLTRVFALLEDGSIVPIEQSAYASIVRGEISVPEHASRCLRIVDWYVRYEDDRPMSVDNETYQLLWFDEVGRARPQADTSCEDGRGRWTPSDAERQRLSRMIFGELGEQRSS